MTLTITTADGVEVLRTTVRDDASPDTLTIAVLKAIREIPLPRKTRSDAGKPKTRAASHAESADATE